MVFLLSKRNRIVASAERGASGAVLAKRVEEWSWTYNQGSEKNIGEILACGPAAFGSEREARSQIAVARKAFGGARMAKVVIPSDD